MDLIKFWRDFDKLMIRTSERPLPKNNLTVLQALFSYLHSVLELVLFKLYSFR